MVHAIAIRGAVVESATRVEPEFLFSESRKKSAVADRWGKVSVFA
jgi:hypothetical protein